MKLCIKPLLFISICILLSTVGLHAQDKIGQVNDTTQIIEATAQQIEELRGESQLQYQEGNFRKAIELLEAEIDQANKRGEASAQLYYNLGNAYFRDGELAKAMLNYERALLYDPGDADIRHNIEYTQTRIEDKILTADNFFLKIWFEGLQNLQPSNSWATLSVVFFVLFIGCLFLFFFAPIRALKKTGFYAGLVLLASLIFTNIFAVNQKSKIKNRNTAIVMEGSVPVASSPSSSSKELFILHAGTKVSVNKTDGSWCEIEIANGSIGWIQKDKIEII
ncbi:MAG: hypothetical protein RL662_961 [Bacteroidota bacterium]|jgi:tetratricopeptide (TPR) repeat protein